MVSVLCVRFGEAYSRDYVRILRNMVSRHLTVPYEFVCLTDDPEPMQNVKSIVQPNAGYKKGWWYKVHMFDPSLPLADTILYFDLDVVIHNNIDKLTNTQKGKILGIRDFNRKFSINWKSLNSSVMCWERGWHHNIFHDFQKNPRQAMRLPGDQDWIWDKERKNIEFYPDEWLQSYKWEIRNRKELEGMHEQRNFKEVNNNVKIGDDCCVTVFHGYPKPKDVKDKFIVNNWR